MHNDEMPRTKSLRTSKLFTNSAVSREDIIIWPEKAIARAVFGVLLLIDHLSGQLLAKVIASSLAKQRKKAA